MTLAFPVKAVVFLCIRMTQGTFKTLFQLHQVTAVTQLATRPIAQMGLQYNLAAAEEEDAGLRQ